MSRFLDFDQPIFFTPPSGKESGPRRLFKGGGGGGSGTPYYSNMDALYGQQARAAGYMLDSSMPYIPQYMNNSSQMVNEAMNGTLASKLRQTAGNDAAAANGASWSTANRNMQRMGANFSTDRMLSEMNKNSIMGAANMSGALNQATLGAEDMKWNRNAGAFGQATGMSSGAMSTLGSAAGGYGAAGANMMANDSANASGMGAFGAQMAKGMMAAGGGYIDGESRRVVDGKGAKLAAGGDPWAAYKAANPVGTSANQRRGPGLSGQLMQVAGGAAPILVGAGLKSAMKSDFVKNNVTAPIKKAAGEAWDGAKQAVGQAYDGAKQAAGQAYDSAKSGLTGQVASESAGQQALAATTTTTDAMAATPDYSADFSKAFAGQGSGQVAGEVATQQAGEAVKDFAVQEIGSEVGQQAGQTVVESTAKDLATMLAEAGVNSALADGGEVRGRRGLRLAMGGLAGVMRMPSVSSLDASSSMKVSSAPVKVSMPSTAKSSGIAAQQQKMAGPSVGDAKTGYEVADKANDAAAKSADAADKASTAASAATTAETAAQAGDTAATINTAVDAAEAANAADSAANAASGASSSAVPYGSIIKAGADILSGEDAGTAVADAAASYAGAEAGAAVGSVVGPVGTVVGGVVGGLLGGSLFADGGAVRTKRSGKAGGYGLRLADGGDVLPNNEYPTALSSNKTLNGKFVNGIARHVYDQTKNHVQPSFLDANYEHRNPVTKMMAFVAQKSKEHADIIRKNEAGQKTNIATDAMRKMQAGLPSIMPAQSQQAAASAGTEEPAFASGGATDPYAHVQKNDELDMWDRLKRNAQRGPGDDILHMTGMHQEGELNSMQKVASAAGDPIGVMVFKANGGETIEPAQRADYTPGGDVQGPGTETSDSIPAWLSDGEIVHNADAVKLAGKDALLAINEAGRDVRDGKASPQEAKQQIGQVMMQRGQQLAGQSVKLADGGDAERLMREMEAKYGVSGKSAPQESAPQQQAQQKVVEQPKQESVAERLRRFATGNLDGRMKSLGLKNGGCAVKLAGGGFLGGNLGIAMGAGVNQWNRMEQMDMQREALEMQKANAERAAQEFQWKSADRQKQDELGKSMADIAGQAERGDIEGYITEKEGEARKAATKSGNTWAGPLTDEQRAVIASTKGVAKVSPYMSYDLDMQRANAFEKSGDAKMAASLREQATQRAAGDAMRAGLAGDWRTFGKLYNIYPDGNTIREMRASNQKDKDGNPLVSIIDNDGNESLQSQYDLVSAALSKLSPTAAANMLANDRKLDERMRQIYAQNNARLAQIEARASARGDGSGKGSKSSDIDGEAMDILDRKKFNDAYLNDETSKGLDGDKAHSWALQLYTAAQRENGVVPYKTRAEIVRMAKDMAAGKKAPGVHFDDETLQFRHGVMDEGGNFRPLKPGPVAHNAINTSTNTPFFDDAGKKKAEIGGLTKFSQQDPAGYRQAFELAQSKTPKELEAIAQQNPAFAKYANAARLIQLYPPKPAAAPTKPGGNEQQRDYFGPLDSAKLWQLEKIEQQGVLRADQKRELDRLRDLKKNGGTPWYKGQASAEDSAS